MSLARGKYGVEFDPRQMEKEPSGLGWIVVAVVAVAVVSLAWTLVGRFRSSEPSDPAMPEPVVSAVPAAAPETNGPPPAVKAAVLPPLDEKVTSSLPKRPVKVRNLLMRLEEAEKRSDVEMAVTTIETIRSLPGSPAADLDDSLARRLGKLNMVRLFELKNAQWVKEVTVKRGDSATRIAYENGSTLASFRKLNGDQVDKVVLGRKLYVLNHPRFNLVVHRRARTADLSLNGKFFKRYDLVGGVGGKEGAYETPKRMRNFWYGELGVQFRASDAVELEMLLPTGTPVLISEM